MSKAIKQFGIAGLVACVVALVGCEFTGAGDGSSWNSADAWVNFSGVYKASSGVLVSDFTTSSGTGTVGTTNTIPVNNEVISQGDGVSTTFSGVLGHHPIVAGSLTISAGGIDLVDNGTGSLNGFNSNGAIDYGTGAWSIDLKGAPLPSSEKITATYSYISSTSGGGGNTGGGGQGSSGKAIYSFTVFQTGNKIEITDNNNAKYTGQLGNVTTTGGINSSSPTTVTPSVGDSVVGEYTAEGTSAAGMHVMMTGTFQGVVSRGSATGASLFLSDRVMLGTWSESGGVTGDINGQSAPIGITLTP